jgi:hypothetical protein
MSPPPEEISTISICTTNAGWNHIVQLLKRDQDPTWAQFNKAIVKIVENVVGQSESSHAQAQYHRASYEDNSPESYGYHIGPDGLYHNQDYFNENYGGYANYERLSSEADDMGFGDEEAYQQWLNDF